MQLARLIGILVVFGVPAIIGGGLMMHLFNSYVPVWIYVALLVAFAIRTACKACSKPAPSDH